MTSHDGGDISLDSGPGHVTTYTTRNGVISATPTTSSAGKTPAEKITAERRSWEAAEEDCGFIACGEQRVKTRIRIIHP